MTTYTETFNQFQTMEAMDQEFARLDYATTDFPEGLYQGRILAVSGLSFLLGPLQLPTSVVDRANPWRGKSFWGDRGANRWMSDTRDAHFGHFRLSIGKSAIDGRRTLLLDYDLPENPAVLRKILGEARVMPEGYLCRMLYRAGGMVWHVLYFTLTK